MSTDTLANQQTGGTAKPADSAAAAAAALAWPDLPRDDPVNQSANSLRQILNAYRQELQGETAENDATRQFNQDLTDLEREYNGISTIVAQYLATYPRLTGTMKPVARTQRDEVQSWCNDEDEVPANLAAAIRALWATYQTKEPQTIAARDAAKNQFNALKSPLDAARSLEADALAALEWLKAFAGRATDYFSQLANLHREARGYLELRNYRQVYAVFLVID